MTAALCLAAALAAGIAEPPPLGPELLADAELDQQRGGFSYAGLDIRFGVEIRSYLGDELVLQTQFNSVDGLQPHLNGATVTLVNQGQTAFIQRTSGTIQNIILNSASGVALRQDLDATLDIGNFAPFRSDLYARRIGSALSAMSALGLAGGHAD